MQQDHTRNLAQLEYSQFMELTFCHDPVHVIHYNSERHCNFSYLRDANYHKILFS